MVRTESTTASEWRLHVLFCKSKLLRELCCTVSASAWLEAQADVCRVVVLDTRHTLEGSALKASVASLLGELGAAASAKRSRHAQEADHLRRSSWIIARVRKEPGVEHHGEVRGSEKVSGQEGERVRGERVAG